MISKWFALLATLLSLVILFTPAVSAQTSPDWNTSDDFGNKDFPTPTPSKTPAATTYQNFIAYVFAAIGIFIIVPIILVVLFLSRGQMDSKTASVLLLIIVTVVVLMLVLFLFIAQSNSVASQL
jgi:uncharacterized membrane protein YjgN (DUF898 family)